MPHNHTIHNRQSIRLQGFDYSKPGFYFITLCVKDREDYFGEIDRNHQVILSGIGQVVKRCWEEIPRHFPHARLDEYVIMPNHIHGIIEITRYPDHFKPDVIHSGEVHSGEVHSGEVQNFEPLRGDHEPLHHVNERINRFQKIIPGSLGSIIRGFKTGVTKWCNQNGYEDFKWQRNFHEVIIRDNKHINNVRNYIKNNPVNWENDDLNYINHFLNKKENI